ncbi:hypothetical protein MRB53_013620 [Persea americana]|uniref:Uncharacterized protein n=1 Tax=Persea americana TaxID=3435 RepID=A0ACC2K8J3_PERAE|nr:hypothetical protein MRB53_013620 [Persea americana]
MKIKLLLCFFLIFCFQALQHSAHGAINTWEHGNPQVPKLLQQNHLQGSSSTSCLNGTAELDGSGRIERCERGPDKILLEDSQRRGGGKAVPASSSSGDHDILRRPRDSGHSSAPPVKAFPSLSIFSIMVQFSIRLLLVLLIIFWT